MQVTNCVQNYNIQVYLGISDLSVETIFTRVRILRICLFYQVNEDAIDNLVTECCKETPNSGITNPFTYIKFGWVI